MVAPLVYGHRGSPRQAIENTLDSFDLAEASGVDGIELDVRVAACGELVLHHSPDFHSGGRQFMISATTWREIRELEAEREAGTYRIPRLDDVLARYGHALDYFVELKPCNVPARDYYEEAVVHSIRRHGLSDHVVIVSFTSELIRRVIARAPEISTSLVFEHPAAIANLGGDDFPKIRALHPRWLLINDELVEKTAALGIEFHAWLINEVDDLELVRKFDVASVSTDEPERILAALGRTPGPPAPPASVHFDAGLRRP